MGQMILEKTNQTYRLFSRSIKKQRTSLKTMHQPSTHCMNKAQLSEKTTCRWYKSVLLLLTSATKNFKNLPNLGSRDSLMLFLYLNYLPKLMVSSNGSTKKKKCYKRWHQARTLKIVKS